MIKLILSKNQLKNLIGATLSVAVMLPLLATVEVTIFDTQYAHAQDKPKPKTKKVQSIRQKLIKDFEKVNEAFEAENNSEVERLLTKITKVEGLNSIERAYVANYRGNICFSNDNHSCALREFKKIVASDEGLPDSFYNQMLYVVAQVLFSQENYREALVFDRLH